ncbi:MAG TPA: acyl-CoA thioesterase [Cyclobacteriaceae bacterium]|nr:acyl-CoA thioesterase [Cyclobacteriaceae bacterium]
MLIRFSDCDLYGHLSNIAYVKYFLDSREDHLSESYGLTLAGFAKQGVGWVVSTNQISYFRPARVNEQVILRSAIVDLSLNHIMVEMQMLDEKRTHVKSSMWSKFVHVSLKDGRKTEHSPDMMDLFGKIKLQDITMDFNTRMSELKTATII